MKAVSFSRISLIVSLAVGIMVLWVTTVPSGVDSDRLVGGWVLVRDCSPCWGTIEQSCQDGPSGSQELCNFNETLVCMPDTDTGGECESAESDPCDDIYHECPGSESVCV